MNKRIHWVDYLKMFACLLIFTWHFFLIFYYRCDIKPDLDSLTANVMGGLDSSILYPYLWVFIFCALSGFLSSIKEIDTFKHLVIEVIFRYLRFFIPILISNLIVFVLYSSIGFGHQSFMYAYENYWLNNYYTVDVTLKEVLKQSLIIGESLNGPLWVIKYIFIGNIFTVVFNFFERKLFGDSRTIYLIISLVVIFAFGYRGIAANEFSYINTIFIGSFIYRTRKDYINIPVLIIGLVLLSLFYGSELTYEMKERFGFYIADVITTSGFLYLIANCSIINKIKGCKFNLGSISFWEYLLHWPFIYFISTRIIMLFNNYSVGYHVTYIISLLAVLFISYLFSITIDKWINALLKKCKNTLM